MHLKNNLIIIIVIKYFKIFLQKFVNLITCKYFNSIIYYLITKNFYSNLKT